jgi:hypothetical protein
LLLLVQCCTRAEVFVADDDDNVDDDAANEAHVRQPVTVGALLTNIVYLSPAFIWLAILLPQVRR